MATNNYSCNITHSSKNSAKLLTIFFCLVQLFFDQKNKVPLETYSWAERHGDPKGGLPITRLKLK